MMEHLLYSVVVLFSIGIVIEASLWEVEEFNLSDSFNGIN